MAKHRAPSQEQKPKLVEAGFEEPRATFVENSPARERFNESVTLLRAFNLIDGTDERQKVIDLARRFANNSED